MPSNMQIVFLFMLFTSCFSKSKEPDKKSNEPEKISENKNLSDSCSIAKPFENVGLSQSMVNADYTGVLNNYMGSDSTKLDFQHFFEKGKLVKSIFYYPNGKVQEAFSYKCGALHGNQKYFYSNGILAKVIPYSYGYVDGVGERYDEKGNLREQVIFKGDSLIGKPKRFDEKGKLLTQQE